MENILNLDIEIKKNVENTINIITENLSNSWTRNFVQEKSIRDMGSEQFVFNYKSEICNNLIYFIERNNQLETTNVLSLKENKISITECNNMLKKFEKDILSKTDLKYSIHN